MPLAAVAGIAAAGSIASGVIGANAAGNAASTQANAANNAAQLEAQTANNSLDFNKLQYGNSLALLSPFYNSGVAANSRLDYLMGLTPNQGLPPGVVNPNASQVGGNDGSISQPGFPAGRFKQLAVGNDSTTIAPNGVDASLARFGGGFSAQGAQVPMTGNSLATMQNLGDQRANGTPVGSGLNLGDQTASGRPLGFGTNQVPIQASTGNPIQANGSPGQVPVLQPGLDPNTPNTSQPGGFGSLAQGWNQTFQSPTNVTEQNDPGYQFRLQQGQLALQNSAAARGGLLSGGTAKALTDYNQNAASNEYGNVYNRALQNYDTNYNTFTNDQTNTFNRLMALQNGGQVSGQNLSASGITAAGLNANIAGNAANQIGQQFNNAGAATASGYVGGANAITGAINNGTNSLSTLALLQALNQGSGGVPAGGNGVI